MAPSSNSNVPAWLCTLFIEPLKQQLVDNVSTSTSTNQTFTNLELSNAVAAKALCSQWLETGLDGSVTVSFSGTDSGGIADPVVNIVTINVGDFTSSSAIATSAGNDTSAGSTGSSGTSLTFCLHGDLSSSSYATRAPLRLQSPCDSMSIAQITALIKHPVPDLLQPFLSTLTATILASPSSDSSATESSLPSSSIDFTLQSDATIQAQLTLNMTLEASDWTALQDEMGFTVPKLSISNVTTSAWATVLASKIESPTTTSTSASTAATTTTPAQTAVKPAFGINLSVQFPISDSSGALGPLDASLSFSQSRVNLRINLTSAFGLETLFSWLSSLALTPEASLSTNKNTTPTTAATKTILTSTGILSQLEVALSDIGADLPELTAIQLSFGKTNAAPSGTTNTSQATKTAGKKRSSISLMDMEVDFTSSMSGIGTSGASVPIALSLSWPTGDNMNLRGSIQAPVNILELTGLTLIPSSLPDEIPTASMTVVSSTPSSGGSTTVYTLDCALQCSDPGPSSGVPALSLDHASAVIEVTVEGGHGSDATMDHSCHFEVKGEGSLVCPPGYANSSKSMGAAKLTAAFCYPAPTSSSASTSSSSSSSSSSSNTWSASASVTDLHMANLYTLLPTDAKDAILDLLASVVLQQAQMSFTYLQGASDPSQLSMTADLLLGQVCLDLSYTHKGNDGSWAFKADLSQVKTTTSVDPTLGSILESLLGKEDEALPLWVSNLTLPLQELQVEMVCCSTPSGAEVVFCLNIDAGDEFSASFVQLKQSGDTASNDASSDTSSDTSSDSNSTGSAASKTPAVLRVLRFTLPKLPSVDVPIIGNLTQPFDELELVWTNRNATTDEISLLNREAYSPQLPLLVKNSAQSGPLTLSSAASTSSKSFSSSASASSVVFKKGLHFRIIESVGPELILDYCASHSSGAKPSTSGTSTPATDSTTGSESSPTSKASDQSAAVANDAADTKSKAKGDSSSATPASSSPPSGKASFTKSCGPLTISSVSLSLSNDNLTVTFDASLRLGPLTFSLIDFDLSLGLSAVKSLSDLTSITPSASVEGLGFDFNKKPTVEVAGAFTSSPASGMQAHYQGGMRAQFSSWGAGAVGMYEIANDASKNLFGFGAVTGVLVDMGWAEIDGFAGGFGYNETLVVPDVSAVSSWPLITISNGSGGVNVSSLGVNELQAFTADNIVAVNEGSMWIAAGLSVQAFQFLNIDAILAFSTAKTDTIDIIAQATAVYPTESPFVLADLGMTAIVDCSSGTIMSSGKLTPRSYILDPSCHLTGGFAFAAWPSGPYEGDFVLTIGGYGPSFSPPSHYPTAPERLEIAWQYDSDLSITGQAYFALTPAVLMGGARLDARLDKGWVTAGFSVYTNFFVQFSPFWFTVSAGFSLYASISIGSGWFSIHLGPLEFSADMHLWGPSMAGSATLHLWHWDVDVSFGASNSAPPTLSLEEFICLVKNVPSGEKETDYPDAIISVSKGRVVSAGGSAASSTAGSGDNSGDGSGTISSISDETETGIQVRASQLQVLITTRFPVAHTTFNDDSTPVKSSQAGIYAAPMQLTSPLHESSLQITLSQNGVPTNKPTLGYTAITKNLAPSIWGTYQSRPSNNAALTPTAYTMGYTVTIGGGIVSDEDLPEVRYTEYQFDPVENDGLVIEPPAQGSTPWVTSPSGKGTPTAAEQAANCKAALQAWKGLLAGGKPAQANIVTQASKVIAAATAA